MAIKSPGAAQQITYTEDGDLLINASCINGNILSGHSLTVQDNNDKIIFSAGMDDNGNPEVQIGGWKVSENELFISNIIYQEGYGLYPQKSNPSDFIYFSINVKANTNYYMTFKGKLIGERLEERIVKVWIANVGTFTCTKLSTDSTTGIVYLLYHLLVILLYLLLQQVYSFQNLLRKII